MRDVALVFLEVKIACLVAALLTGIVGLAYLVLRFCEWQLARRLRRDFASLSSDNLSQDSQHLRPKSGGDPRSGIML